jgi:hypothetical protein
LLHPASFMLEGEREPEVHKPRRLAVRAVVCRETLEQQPTGPGTRRRPGRALAACVDALDSGPGCSRRTSSRLWTSTAKNTQNPVDLPGCWPVSRRLLWRGAL